MPLSGEAKRAYMRARYVANPERQREQARAWRAANLERKRESSRLYAKEHSAETMERVKRWVAANPERHRAHVRAYNSRNRDKIRAARRAYKKRNPAQVALDNSRRRERLAGVVVVASLVSSDCFVCGFPLGDAVTIGHEPPLAYCVKNGLSSCVVRPEHPSCNFQKGAKIDSEMSFSWP